MSVLFGWAFSSEVSFFVTLVTLSGLLGAVLGNMSISSTCEAVGWFLLFDS